MYVDNTFAEGFFQGGRTVLTRSVGKVGHSLAAGMAVVGNSSGALVMESAEVWRVNSIWVSPNEV